MSSARIAVSAVFAMHGLASGMWVSRIPAVQEDLRLGVADVGSAYLGAFTFERLADAMRVEEITDGALARATAIFRTERPPYCPEIF